MPGSFGMVTSVNSEPIISIHKMKTKTQLLVELWTEARTRFEKQLNNLAEGDIAALGQ